MRAHIFPLATASISAPGSALAKMQLQIVIEELTARVPTLRLAPDQTIDYARNTSFRAPGAILVKWDR
jgi:cytochrome P450